MTSINMTVPSAVAKVATRLYGIERPHRMSYPRTSGESSAAVACWLLDGSGDPEAWLLGENYRGPARADQRVQAVARRLRFFRWLHEDRFLARGGRLP